MREKQNPSSVDGGLVKSFVVTSNQFRLIMKDSKSSRKLGLCLRSDFRSRSNWAVKIKR